MSYAYCIPCNPHPHALTHAHTHPPTHPHTHTHTHTHTHARTHRNNVTRGLGWWKKKEVLVSCFGTICRGEFLMHYRTISWAGAATSITFCRDKPVFVATKHVFCHDKRNFVATKLSSRQTYLVATKPLSLQIFVATNIATKHVFCRDKPV